MIDYSKLTKAKLITELERTAYIAVEADKRYAEIHRLEGELQKYKDIEERLSKFNQIGIDLITLFRNLTDDELEYVVQMAFKQTYRHVVYSTAKEGKEMNTILKIKLKNGEELNFLETGVDGIYILDHVAFQDKFDEDGNSYWEESSGKKKLQEWAEKSLPEEILEHFDVDLPTVEEVFSQKMLNWWSANSLKVLVSKQFPIFKDSDERMKEFDGKLACWWTRSANYGCIGLVWYVYPDGGMCRGLASSTYGFVPVLRKKEELE